MGTELHDGGGRPLRWDGASLTRKRRVTRGGTTLRRLVDAETDRLSLPRSRALPRQLVKVHSTDRRAVVTYIATDGGDYLIVHIGGSVPIAFYPIHNEDYGLLMPQVLPGADSDVGALWDACVSALVGLVMGAGPLARLVYAGCTPHINTCLLFRSIAKHGPIESCPTFNAIRRHVLARASLMWARGLRGLLEVARAAAERRRSLPLTLALWRMQMRIQMQHQGAGPGAARNPASVRPKRRRIA